MASLQTFDVFISFKNSDFDGNSTKDSQIARQVHDELAQRGINCFYSNSSLLSLGQSAYKKSINDALDSAKVLVVVASSLKFLNSDWVSYEWDSFHNDILSGSKPEGQIVPYFGNFERMEIPRDLRDYQTFSIDIHTAEDVADFVENIIKNLNSKKQENEEINTASKINIKSQISTKKVRESYYASDADQELRRLKVQSTNTHECDMAVLNKIVEKFDRPLWILDLGCAYNYVGNMRFGKMENVKVLGIDISEKCLSYAAETSDPDKFVFRYLDLEGDTMQENLCEIMDELGIEKFDIMFGALLLLHLKKPVSVLKKLRRFLSDDGYIILRGSDDGSVMALNDDGVVDKIIQKCHTTVGFSDRQNGRKLYHQLESAGYKDIKLETFIKDLSGKDIDERDDIYFERFSYRVNNFRKISEADPKNIDKRNDYLFMKYALEELEEMFTKHDFWYCEHDFIAYGKAK